MTMKKIAASLLTALTFATASQGAIVYSDVVRLSKWAHCGSIGLTLGPEYRHLRHDARDGQ